MEIQYTVYVIKKIQTLKGDKNMTNTNQNIFELMVEEWDSYEDNWIIKMQAEGLIKPDLSEKEYDQLFYLLTGGEY